MGKLFLQSPNAGGKRLSARLEGPAHLRSRCSVCAQHQTGRETRERKFFRTCAACAARVFSSLRMPRLVDDFRRGREVSPLMRQMPRRAPQLLGTLSPQLATPPEPARMGPSHPLGPFRCWPGRGHKAALVWPIVTAKKNYSVVLEGVDAHDLSMAVLRDLCDLLLEGSQRSVRLAAEGRSVARGAQPSWVAVAADCRITNFEAGSLALSVQASALVDVAPEIFAQEPLFPSGTDSGATAFDLFLDSAEDAAAGRRDSERLDAGVLDVLARTGALFSKGGTRLTLAGAGHARHAVVEGGRPRLTMAISPPL